MTWLNEPLEEMFRTTLASEIGHGADELIASYGQSISRLRADIWPLIAAAEPHLTNHGEPHICHVMRNASFLLKTTTYSAIDLFTLATMILFHDVGNLNGRVDHNLKIAEIYDDIHPRATSNTALRSAVLFGCAAHCGFAPDGSADTLSAIGPDPYPLAYSGIHLQQMAAILRFADEVSEDPRRTSRYMLNHHKIPLANQVYHWYANITSPRIDAESGRVILHYNILLPEPGNPEREQFENLLEERLAFLFHRISKLDLERRYNGYYSAAVRKINRTEFSIYVHSQHARIPLQERPYVLSDLVSPDTAVEPLLARWPELAVEAMKERILKGEESVHDPSKSVRI